jgi:hypothetical protein
MIGLLIFSLISPPRQDASSQTLKVNQIAPQLVEPVIKYDSSTNVIKAKLDSLELNISNIKKNTDKVESTTSIILKNRKELRKHTQLLDESLNLIKYDSLKTVEANKVDPIKKNDNIVIVSDSLRLPEVKVNCEHKKSFIKRWFGFK